MITDTLKIYCDKCSQELAIVKSDREIQLTEKSMMAVIGITTEGNISGSLTCLGCGYTRIINPIPLMDPMNYSPIIFEKGETFTSNRVAKLEDKK